MRSVVQPDAFFTLEHTIAEARPRLSFFVKHDKQGTPLRDFIEELCALYALTPGHPGELWRRYGLPSIYAVLVVSPTEARLRMIRDALRDWSDGRFLSSDLFWFATEQAVDDEEEITAVRWLPTADEPCRRIVFDPSKWIVRGYREAA